MVPVGTKHVARLVDGNYSVPPGLVVTYAADCCLSVAALIAWDSTFTKLVARDVWGTPPPINLYYSKHSPLNGDAGATRIA